MEGDDLSSPGASPRVSLAADGGRAQRTITLSSAQDYYQSLLDHLGYSCVAEKTNGLGVRRYVMRVLPHSFRGFSDQLSAPPPEQISGQPPGTFYTYTLPANANQYGWFWCKSAPDTEGVGPYGQGGDQHIPAKGPLDPAVAYYRTNKLRLEYRMLDYGVLPDWDTAMVNGGGPLQSTPADPIPDEGTLNRYVTGVFRTAKKVINLRRGLMSFDPEPGSDDNGKAQPLPEGFSFEEASGTLVLVWHEVPLDAIPWKAVVNCDNAVNVNPFWFGRFPPGTVRFDTWDRKELFSPVGLRMVDIQYTFKVAWHVDLAGTPRGWNSALRLIPPGGANAGSVDYRGVRAYAADRTTPGNPPYRSMDLADLFRPDQPP